MPRNVDEKGKALVAEVSLTLDDQDPKANSETNRREIIPSDIELTQDDIEFLNIKVVSQPWYRYFSPSDTKEERRLLVKLDLLILLYLFLSSFVKTLDSSAVSYVYVSGMKEDLRMFGNELTYQNSCFMAGFIIGQIPLTMLAMKLASYILVPTNNGFYTRTFHFVHIQN